MEKRRVFFLNSLDLKVKLTRNMGKDCQNKAFSFQRLRRHDSDKMFRSKPILIFFFIFELKTISIRREDREARHLMTKPWAKRRRERWREMLGLEPG